MKKKIFSLLVLLVAAVSGAWAATTVNFENGVIPTDWNNSETFYLWAITDGNGGKCLKSSNSGVQASTSEISVTVTYYQDGTFEFDAECCGEGTSSAYDKCQFLIDGAEQFTYGAQVSGWNHYSYDITAGEHTFTWKYSKDSSVNATGDYMAIDNVVINNGAGGFALTKDADAGAHGTISFTVGEGESAKENATTAKAGDVVTVTITPEEDYVPGSTITVQPYGKIENAMARRNIAGQSSIEIAQPFEVPINITETDGGTLFTATFTMPEANAQISVPYLKLLTSDDITIEAIPDQTYTGQAIEPTLVVKDGETELEEGVDYTVSYFNNTNAAQTTDENPPVAAIIAVVGSEKYVSGNVFKFNILPATITDEMIAPVADQTYAGSGVQPDLTITFGEDENAQTLVKGTDFTVDYTNNVEKGVATATATGQGNFTGTASVDFNIISKPLTINMIAPIPDQEYTGEPQEPDLEVKNGDIPLTEGIDYTVEYENNTETGKATVIITGIGNYEGTATAYFYVGRKDLNDDCMKVEYIYWEHYDGQKHTPQLTIRDGTKQLIEDKDYKVTFKNNVDAGTANVTIEGIGSYKGKVKKYFAIKSYVLDIDMVQNIADQTWTGEAVTPAISVINGNVTLTQDKDFTVKFKNNVNEGTATAIINGTGNFRSIDLVKTFKIVKKAEVTDPEAVEAPGEATAIGGVSGKTADHGQAYDLGGRKAKANRKGVVIIDGKLVLKK